MLIPQMCFHAELISCSEITQVTLHNNLLMFQNSVSLQIRTELKVFMANVTVKASFDQRILTVKRNLNQKVKTQNLNLKYLNQIKKLLNQFIFIFLISTYWLS